MPPISSSAPRRAAVRRAAVRRAALIPAVLILAACSETPGGDAASRGRTVYLAQCMSCHGQDPGQAGPLGPPIKGASRALLEAKVLRANYPAGYAPKRDSTLMPPMPQLESSIPELAAFLE